MIKRLKIQNFKSIREAEIDLERFTVFVGPNASGKTSILQAVQHLSWATAPNTKNEQLHALDFEDLGRRAEGTSIHIEGNGVWNGATGRLALTVNSTTDDFEAKSELDGNQLMYVTRSGPVVSPRRSTDDFGETLRAGMLLQLDAKVLAQPSIPAGPEQFIESDGAGLTSVLAQMALNKPDDFEQLLVAVRTVIPLLQRIRFSLTELRRSEVESITVDEETINRTIRRKYPLGHGSHDAGSPQLDLAG
jgi:energy-coupling factor transporter ATP-binding protein EcfA2